MITTDLEDLATQLAERCGPAKVLIIVDGPDGIVAACTEADGDEIRGLMYRAGAALPERLT